MIGKTKKIIIIAIVCLAIIPVSYKIYRKMKISNSIEEEIKSPHWQERYALFESEIPQYNGIVFLGNSLTERMDFDSVGGKYCINRGISGDFTNGVLKRLDQVIKLKPAKVFIEIGINDLVEMVPPEGIVESVGEIVDELKKNSAASKLYVYSLTPTILPDGFIRSSEGQNREIVEANVLLKKMCEEKKIPFIDIHHLFVKDKRLNPEYTDDGIHLTSYAYSLWKKEIEPYVLE